LVAEKLPVKEELPLRVTKEGKAVLVINGKWLMKVVKCPSNADYQNVDSKTHIVFLTLFFNLSQIEQLAEKYDIKEISAANLYANGLIARTDMVKILGNGELKTKLNFKVNAASEKAKLAIKNAGGSLEIQEVKKVVMGAKS